MKNVLPLLEDQRRLERDLVAETAKLPVVANGWPASLLLFHIYRWRERLRDGLRQMQDGKPVVGPPENIDEFNNSELAQGAQVSLEEAANRADRTMGEVIDLWRTIGDRPFTWFTAKTTGEALIRNSYIHPRNHIREHFVERGARDRGDRISEETVAALRAADAPAHVMALLKP